MYFDSHAHLDSERFDEDRAAVMEKIRAAGVDTVMNAGCSYASSRSSIALAEQYDFIYAAIGTHPEDADEVDDALLTKYRALAAHPKVRAIGEIGLDYYYPDNPPHEVQKQAFRAQLALAQELSMPVIVHVREASADSLEIVREFPDVRGVFHCFSGALPMAKELVSMGWYLGFTGVITFKNARKALEVAEWAPLSRLLIETDCPYMAPEPYRGQRNDPSYVGKMAEKIAELKGVPLEQVAKQTAENAKTLFGI